MFDLWPYLRPRRTMRARSLEQTIKVSDLHTKHSVVKALMRRVNWRQQPATESQKTFIESRWKKALKYVQGETTRRCVQPSYPKVDERGDREFLLGWASLRIIEYKMKAMRKGKQLQLKELRKQAREVVTICRREPFIQGFPLSESSERLSHPEHMLFGITGIRVVGLPTGLYIERGAAGYDAELYSLPVPFRVLRLHSLATCDGLTK
ncbi:hypothetical protein BDM02DRAFT_3211160 [Thelephora ganbajun]|uniref:Uncharacterized protein n=1 Tax=Thelephora ganbajun TaxID=370292 RepID=A0ACB6Z4N3_THEGA|nr:hypothetical protein BDM02DRAFT_3211160 [Thelephora ganbajun]